jgi:hypothetical protein
MASERAANEAIRAARTGRALPGSACHRPTRSRECRRSAAGRTRQHAHCGWHVEVPARRSSAPVVKLVSARRELRPTLISRSAVGVGAPFTLNEYVTCGRGGVVALRRLTCVSGILAALLLVGSVAWASIPDSNGVIHGCRKSTDGSIRVIDTSKTATCPNGYTALNWNQAGVQGPAGPAGAPGTTVNRVQLSKYLNDGAPVAPGSVGDSLACPEGYYVTGGGYEFNPASTPTLGFRPRFDGPVSGWGPEGTAWSVAGETDVAGSFRIWAFCLKLE